MLADSDQLVPIWAIMAIYADYITSVFLFNLSDKHDVYHSPTVEYFCM